MAKSVDNVREEMVKFWAELEAARPGVKAAWDRLNMELGEAEGEELAAYFCDRITPAQQADLDAQWAHDAELQAAMIDAAESVHGCEPIDLEMCDWAGRVDWTPGGF